MDSDRESESLFSLRLSRVMGDIGVNSWLIARRRRTHLMRETIYKVYDVLSDVNRTAYIFGSQSEGTTTPGMESDTDYMLSNNSGHVALDWRNWKYAAVNLLVLKNELTPPQHCYLQRLRDDCPLPAVQPEGPDDVLDREGRIILTNTRVKHQDLIQKQSESGEIIRHGPSMSHDERIDKIHGYHCSKLPEECKFMFYRPRPGHWPRPETLASARETGVFLVPQGYTESPSKQSLCRSKALMIPSKLTSYPYSKWQWRFSTSLMERFLMFDFNTVQVKVYTLTKILRKTCFKPMFGDRFSTFHIKTAMLFTIENYPTEIWRENKIVKCVCLLLTTLKRWFKQKYCPHFTISGVNLFVGKLHNWELPNICSIISHLINTKLQCLFCTHMDNIDMRLLHCSDLENVSYEHVGTRTQNYSVVLQKILFYVLAELTTALDELITDYSADDIERHFFILQSMSASLSDLEQEVVFLMTPFLCSTLASMLASKCIYLGQPSTHDIFNWYQMSLDSDLMSSRLKFASMFYCSGQYEETAEVLTYCEGLLGPEVCQFCGHTGRGYLFPSIEFGKKMIFNSSTEILRKCIMMCVTFTKEEINCIPEHLAFEMFRSIEGEDSLQDEKWKNNVVADCVPFLYYLQYLTYSRLQQTWRAQTALHNLHEYTVGTRYGHIDTAHNMLGHCYELENRLDLAWMCYNRSMEIYDRDNVSIRHAARILYQFLQS